MAKHLIGNKTAGVDYSKINSMWDVLVTDVSDVKDMQRFTPVSYTHLTLPTTR